ncbi:MAG: LysR family transcriptional regulator [Rubrivivax sp.]|nr:LysR family transcriptional regulator [Rubrivivax sp.]
MTNPLDLRRLRHLQAVLAEGSLTGAARQLGLSQPALSASIKSLEADLGVALLERHRLGVKATAYADLLVASARQVDAELAQAWTALARLKGSETISLRIGCGPSEATRLLPAALQRLHQSDPQLRVSVDYGLNEALMPMVRRGEVDFALSSIPRSAAHPELAHHALYSDSAVIVARNGHPLAARRTVTAKDLAAYPWVLARRWELERKALDELFAQAGLKPVEAQVETSSAVLMKALVLHGDYLSFVPQEMVFWEERANLLHPLKGVRSSWERLVGITTLREQPLAAPAQRLFDCLHQVARGWKATQPNP